MLLAALPAAEGGFDWGRRLPTIVAEAPARGGPEAWVVEVHTAADARGLRLRLTFDRPAAEALYLRDGTPVSGRRCGRAGPWWPLPCARSPERAAAACCGGATTRERAA